MKMSKINKKIKQKGPKSSLNRNSSSSNVIQLNSLKQNVEIKPKINIMSLFDNIQKQKSSPGLSPDGVKEE